MKLKNNAYIDEYGIVVFKKDGHWKVIYNGNEATVTPPEDSLDCAYSMARQLCWLYCFCNKPHEAT